MHHSPPHKSTKSAALLLTILLSLLHVTLPAQTLDYESAKAKAEKLLTQGRTTEAKTAAELAATISPNPGKKSESSPTPAQKLWLGDFYLRLGQFSLSEKTLKSALTKLETHPESPQGLIADLHTTLGKLYLESGMGILAEDHLSKAVAIYDHTVARLQKAQAQEQWAGLCLMIGRLSDAEHLYDSIMVQISALHGPESPELARILNNLGGVYQAQGRQEKAAGAYDHALHLQSAALGADHPALATTYTNIGVLREEMTDYPAAEEALLRAYAIRAGKLPLHDPLLLTSLDNLVAFYVKRSQFDKAQALLDAAKRERMGKLGGDAPAVADLLDRYATLSMARDQAILAEQYWLEALTIRENALGSQDPAVAANLYNLGKLENVLHRNDQARIHLNWAMDIYERQSLGNEAQITAILSELFICDFMQGKINEAAEQLELMYTIKATVYGPEHPETVAVLEEQLKFYQQVEWLQKAEEVEAILQNLTKK
ncbi:MAG: tetratricopeptide repeat protein [Bacteroidia bacterium]